MQRPGLRWAVAILALYALVQGSELNNARNLHGDESFYIQAAHRMVEAGDWLVPRHEDGRLRFQKPILPYWHPFQGAFRARAAAMSRAVEWCFCAMVRAT